MENNIEAKQSKRGAFLWIMLSNYIVVSVSRLLTLLFPTFFANVYAGGPSWGYTFNLFLLTVEVVGLIGMFVWKRWAVYLMVVGILIGVSQDFLHLSSQNSIPDIILTMPILVLFMWAVKRKWTHFK